MATIATRTPLTVPPEVGTRGPNVSGLSAEWHWLNTIGGVAALAVVALVPVQVAVYLIWPPPTTAGGYFIAFHDSALIGLLDQDLLLMVDEILMIVVVLALYVALRRTSESFMAIALVLAMVGTALFLASNTSFNMLALSDQYAAATTEEQRSMLLAAGAATLAGYQGSAFVVGYALTAAADLVMAVVMLRSNVFGKLAAGVGIVYGITALVPPAPSLGTVGLVFSMAALVPMIVWLVLIARGLLRLNRVPSS